MPAPQTITPHEILSLIGHPACPVLVDVCIDEDVAADPFLVPGAFRHPFSDPEGIAARLGGCPAIVICQKGRKLSQGVAAWLRSDGIDAVALEGGNYGWRDTLGALRIPLAAIPFHDGSSTLWTTSSEPDADTLAATWLIRRFVDRKARFLFVPSGDVTEVAARFGAEALFGPSAFSDLVARFELAHPQFDKFAPCLTAPEIDILISGLWRLHVEPEALSAAVMPIFDALYQGASE